MYMYNTYNDSSSTLHAWEVKELDDAISQLQKRAGSSETFPWRWNPVIPEAFRIGFCQRFNKTKEKRLPLHDLCIFQTM